MSTRNVNKTFRDIFGQLHTQEYKATKEKMLRLQLNEKNAKESQTRLRVDTEYENRPEEMT